MPVALPLVSNTRIRYTIGIADVGGEVAADFRFTRDAYRAFAVARLGRVVADLVAWAACDVFEVAPVVAVGCFGGDALALIRSGQGVARALANFLPVGIPAVLDVGIAGAVRVSDGSGQCLPDFCLASEGNHTSVVCRRGRDFCRLASRFFCRALVVCVFSLHGDFVPGIVWVGGVDLAVGVGNRLAVALPLVSNTRIRYTISIADVGGEVAADFRFTRDAYRAFVIRLWVWLRIWRGDVSNRRCCLA